MNIFRPLLLLAGLVFLAPSVVVAADADEMQKEFNTVIQGLNRNSFDRFNRAIDQSDMTDRVYSRRLVEPAVKTAFEQEFTTSIQQMFTSSFPSSKKEILGTVLDFRFENDQGRAVVRYEASGYRFIYHAYELRADDGGRLRIVDWIDYYQGGRFSDEAGAALVMALPSKAATRNMLADKTLDDGQVFQAGELFKAARDGEAERFFQIHDDLDDTLREEEVVVRLSWQVALGERDGERVEAAAQRIEQAFPGDALHAMRLVEHYVASQQFDKAIAALETLQQELGVRDGATESLKTSAAIALGNLEDAERFAVQATQSEPTLELAWWSLLRARTEAGNYGGATEAMARLEDDFGETMSPGQLRKDRYLRVLADQQEYLDWRASRE